MFAQPIQQRVLALLLACATVAADASEKRPLLLYAATYSPHAGEGIFVAGFDVESGILGKPQPAGSLKSPAALTVHPGGQVVYATTSNPDPTQSPTGSVVALAIDDDTGALTEIDRRSSFGSGPCYLSLDNAASILLVANCGTANVACWQLQADGRFGSMSTALSHRGESRNSEGKPQAHSIVPTPSGRFALAADLGLDRLFMYRLDAARALLTPHDPPFVEVTGGAGPRHIAIHSNGRFAYSVNELGNTITALCFGEAEQLLHVMQEISTTPEGFGGESYAAEIQVHPTGRTLYASNRGHDSLAMFSIDDVTGRLRAIGHVSSQGRFPRHFAIDPTGAFLVVANQKSDSLAVFAIDADTGRLTVHGLPISIPAPVCVRFAARR